MDTKKFLKKLYELAGKAAGAEVKVIAIKEKAAAIQGNLAVNKKTA